LSVSAKSGVGSVRYWQRATACAFIALAAGLVLAVLFPSPVSAQGITAIEVNGNRTISAETIQAQLTLKSGGPYQPDEAGRSIKALFATGMFSDVRIDRRGTTVVVTVIENPVISRIAFEGNTAIEKAKLEPQVQLAPRARYTAARAHADAVRIRSAYRSLGRLATTVDAKAVPQPNGQIEVVFVIKEGEVTKIDSIAFAGNRAIPSSQLRDVISTSQSGWLDIFKTAAFYDPERIEQDKELLRRHYLKLGFPVA
jgi:outer membrane protein insertion porin family